MIIQFEFPVGSPAAGSGRSTRTIRRRGRRWRPRWRTWRSWSCTAPGARARARCTCCWGICLRSAEQVVRLILLGRLFEQIPFKLQQPYSCFFVLSPSRNDRSDSPLRSPDRRRRPARSWRQFHYDGLPARPQAPLGNARPIRPRSEPGTSAAAGGNFHM